MEKYPSRVVAVSMHHSLLAELDLTMALAGARSVRELDRTAVT